MKKAVVLLSGGLDSAVTLNLAKQQGWQCLCLIFDYGQRHKKEIEAAKLVAKSAGCKWQLVKIPFPWKGSALLDKNMKVTKSVRSEAEPPRRAQDYKVTSSIPSTYVPARNIIFLSMALSCAEAIGAGAIYIGAHAQDYSGYPDCRPGFFQAFKKVVTTGTKAGVNHKSIEIKTPLIAKTKSQIIRLGIKLGVDFGLTWSCYKGGSKPCLDCDSCNFRMKGFRETGIIDPLVRQDK